MRKNILILGHSDATQFIDIYNQYTRIFDPSQYSVTVAFLTGEPKESVRERTIAEEVIFLNVPKKRIRGLKLSAIYRLTKLCREKQFDIVVCHRYKPAYIMMWVAQFCQIPALVFVLHELRTMKSLNRQLLIRALYRKNMLFAGVSNAVRDDLQKSLTFIPKENVITLYNMIDIDMTEPALYSREEARSKLGIATGDFVFGNIARLARNKNQHTLIHSFSLIKTNCPNATLFIIGDGELEDELKQQVNQAGLSKDIIFTGFLPAGYRYMKAFDCFVLPSTQEAFGRVLLEAMVAKIPVIAASVNGIPEVVGDCGIIIDPKNAGRLATEMQHVYNITQTERDELGMKGYARAHDHFSIPTFFTQFWQVPLFAALKEPT